MEDVNKSQTTAKTAAVSHAIPGKWNTRNVIVSIGVENIPISCGEDWNFQELVQWAVIDYLCKTRKNGIDVAGVYIGRNILWPNPTDMLSEVLWDNDVVLIILKPPEEGLVENGLSEGVVVCHIVDE